MIPGVDADVVWLQGDPHLLDPAAGLDRHGDLWVQGGVVAGVGEAPPPGLRERAHVVAAAGRLVTPAFVDLHVHLREPGGEAAETMASGGEAALAGGYAVVYAMPNTDPVCDTAARYRDVRDRAAAAAPCEVVPVAALSEGLRGRRLVDLEGMAAAGATCFSDDGAWLADERLAEEAFRRVAALGGLVMQHCEDFGLTGPGVLHACGAVHAAGLPGIPREAEERAVRRDLELAARTGVRFHVCHVSTPGAVEALRRARARGLPVSGEVAPHHLLLDCADALRGGPDWKMKPPVRERADRDALLEGLVDGTLGAVATDHAPHAEAAKARGLREAPFGAIGLETAFAALYTGLVQPGRLALPTLVGALTAGPAAIAGRPAPALRVGAPARLTILDLGTQRAVDAGALRSRSRNCPFEGLELRGWPERGIHGPRVLDLRPPPVG